MWNGLDIQTIPVFPTYETTDGMINLLRRHYLPLLDLKFLELYDRMKLYSNDLRFVVNEESIKPGRVVEEMFRFS